MQNNINDHKMSNNIENKINKKKYEEEEEEEAY